MRKLFSLLTAILFAGAMWAANAKVDDVLWSEDFSGFSDGANPSGTYSSSVSHTGTVVYSGSITYAVAKGTDSQPKVATEASGATGLNLLLYKKNSTFTVSDIPTGGATEVTLAYYKGGSGTLAITGSDNISITGSTITINSGTSFNLTFKNTNTSSNLRLDGLSVVVKTAGADCDNNVTVSAGTPSNGTFSLDKSGELATCAGAVEVVVTPAPAEHYKATGVTASNSTSISEPDENGKYTVTYAQNTNAASEINVSFGLKENYTITWNNNGDQSVTTTVDEEDKPAFPSTPESCDGTSTTFVGWAAAAWSGKVANLSGKTVYYSADEMPAATADAEYFAVFAKAGAEASVSGGDMTSGVTEGWSSSGTGTYSGNGVKFDGADDYIESPDLSEGNYRSVIVKLKAGHNGGSGSVLTIATYDNSDNVITSKTFTPTEAYTSQSTINTFNLSGGKYIKYVRVTMTSKTNNLGMKYCEIFATPQEDFMTTCAAAGQCETPTFSVEEGSYTEAQSVVISCATDGASIYYTLDGTDPTSASTLYEDPIAVKATTTIKAIAIKEGNTDSGIAEVTYHIIPVAPTFTPAESETVYTEALNVTIAAADGTTIYYTTDGSTPTTESAVYSAAIELNSYGVHTIKAIAVKGEEISSVASATYTLKVPFTSFTELVQKLGKTQTEDISINFTDEVITGVYENSSSVRKGVFLNVKDADGTKDIEIYYNVGEEAVPAAWVANGKLSGTITGNWTVYKGQWELVPTTANWTWSNLTYKAPTPTSIDNTEAEGQAVKVVENGQIFIIRGDKTYTLTGALVK